MFAANSNGSLMKNGFNSLRKFAGGRKSGRKSSAKPNHGRRNLQFEGLENRDMFAVYSLWFTAGNVLMVTTDNTATSVSVSQVGSNIRISDVGTNRSWDYAASSIGKVAFQGGAGNDQFINRVSNLPVRAMGGAGNDYLEGYNGADLFSGGDGNDTLVGYGGNDQLIGNNGDDILRGMDGDDSLSGGSGIDHVDGGAGKDKMSGGDDADVLLGGTGVDELVGDGGNDRLIGGDGGDLMYGNDGDDVMWGGQENNSYQSTWDDNDTMLGGYGIDQMHGGGCSDWVLGEGGNDWLWGDIGNDYLYGGNDNDAIYGGAGLDEVWGEMGSDWLFGGTENDRLVGGDQFDYLHGDEGDDWLDPSTAGEYVYDGSGRDINPFVTVVGRAEHADITQGSGNTCWILASIGAVSQYEDLSQRITYLGNNRYAVRLFQFTSPANPYWSTFVSRTQYVYFDGSRLASDPGFNNQEGETWMIIMQRAIIQTVAEWDSSQTLTAPHSGGAAHALGILTGRPSTTIAPTFRQTLENLLISGKRVVAHTNTNMTTSLIRFHVYMVLNVIGNTVTLYNPHGAFVSVPWETFASDVSSIVYV